MVIYGNNLHEKLQGLAISREYLKYNTPFCDIVDDPFWQTDINLALDYNCAINGNTECATKVVQSLTLNSNVLDSSTIEFYLHKIRYNPIFSSAIKDMRRRWSNLNGYDHDFQFDLLKALEDCLNSPCNLFTETSDSIGRMAQSASTKTSDNTMGFESLEGSMTNMRDGLDQTITNKIPAIFEDAFTEVVGIANKAFTNTQDLLVGKKNLSDLQTRVQQGKSFRDPAKVFRYSPDVKSYYDYSAASSNVLAKIKEDLGGCFNRFEFKYRYNPYNNNMARPIGEKTQHVNGIDVDTDATGTFDRSRPAKDSLNKQTTVTKPEAPSVISTNTADKAFTDGDVRISKTYFLNEKSDSTNQHFSVFSSLIDTDTKTLWYETFDATPDDKLTLQGAGNVGANFRIGISTYGTNNDFIKRALNGESVSTGELQRYGDTTQPGAYAAGYKHNLTDTGMETLYNWGDTQTFNDGVAISRALFREFLNDPRIGVGSNSYKKPQLANQFFVAARPSGETTWKYYKVCDSNSQKDINVDFTVGAWKHFLNSYTDKDLSAASRGLARRRPIAGTDWTRVQKIFTEKIGRPMEIRVCQGSLDDIKVSLEGQSIIVGNDTTLTLPSGDGSFTGTGVLPSL